MSIQKLIDRTFSYSLEAQDAGLADLYLADTADFKQVQWLMNSNDIDGALAKIGNMDTEPREQILLAIAEEYGNGYVETVIGYEVA